MAWAKPTTITAWSFSRWNTYNQCPYKARLLYIDKLKQPSSPAMDRGTAIHKLAENYTKGLIRNAPKELGSFAPEFKELRGMYSKSKDMISVEETWAFRKDWSITRWDDWNGCWLRVKLDMAHRVDNRAIVTDVKTGKFSSWNLSDYTLQIELYALSGLVVYANVPNLEVAGRLLYVDHGITYPEPGSTDEIVYTKKDLPRLKKEWLARVKPMLSDKTFKPKPNNFCGSCHFRKSNNGPCQY